VTDAGVRAFVECRAREQAVAATELASETTSAGHSPPMRAASSATKAGVGPATVATGASRWSQHLVQRADQ